jgi:hypothetical protein
MSTNTTTLHRGSIQYARGALAALLAVILLAAAALVALNAGTRVTGSSAAPASNVEVQKALIDVRAGERASRGASVPTATFWALFRASERDMR